MNDVIVYTKNLTKKFDDFTAVDNISFEVKKGEIFGFLGPNGAGKTTTIRMLCGLLVPSEGEIFVSGFNVAKQPEEVKKRTGYMSQKFSLYNYLTVRENMEFYAGIYNIEKKQDGKKITEIFEKVEIEDEKDRLISDLAAGIKQRVALGCAIIHNPDVVFLDEPTAGVDPILRKKFWEIIEELSENGKTIFVTTHYMDEVEHCHRLALMDAGKIIQEGTVKEIKENVFKEKVYSLYVNDAAKTYNILQNKKDILTNISIHGAYLHILTFLEKETFIIKISELLKENKINLIEINEVEPTMDDVFVKLIRG